jgi:hypothetical protein
MAPLVLSDVSLGTAAACIPAKLVRSFLPSCPWNEHTFLHTLHQDSEVQPAHFIVMRRC